MAAESDKLEQALRPLRRRRLAEFHTAIVRAARNPLLARLCEDLAEPIDQTRRASLARPGRPLACATTFRWPGISAS